MTWPRAGSGDPERGSVMVEAAFVLPLLVMFILAGVDLGMWVFQSTQATSAARSGARVGIVRYREADQPNSVDALAIRVAVERDMDVRDGSSVVIRCVAQGGTTALPGGCQSANIMSPDRILVTVSWERPSLTVITRPFGATQKVTGTAVMAINGRPPGVLP